MVSALMDEGHQKCPTALPAAGSSTNGRSSSVKAFLKGSDVCQLLVLCMVQNIGDYLHMSGYWNSGKAIFAGLFGPP